ncbi:MAG: LptF/LptG family permease [Bacillota bacterium]
MRNLLKLKLVDQHLIRTLLTPFVVGVILITIIMISELLFQLADLMIIKDVSLVVIARMLSYKLPSFIVETIPIALLFAVMLGIGKLSKDNEILALKMGGISLYRLLIPLLIVGILLSGTIYWLNESLVPWSNQRYEELMQKSVLQFKEPALEKNLFYRGEDGTLFYVRKYQKKKELLQGVVIFNYPQHHNQELAQVITALQGVEKKNSWLLEDVTIHQSNSNGVLEVEEQLSKMKFKLPQASDQFLSKAHSPAEMTRSQLRAEIKRLESSGLDTRDLRVEYQLRLAQPLIAVIFILVGMPLSLSLASRRAVNLIATVVIIFGYYLITALAQAVGKNGDLLPLLAVWLPNLIFAVLGLLLLLAVDYWRDKFREII